MSVDWTNVKACNGLEADYILMKLGLQNKRCHICEQCLGPICDIYTTPVDQARLGKYLIEQELKK